MTSRPKGETGTAVGPQTSDKQPSTTKSRKPRHRKHADPPAAPSSPPPSSNSSRPAEHPAPVLHRGPPLPPYPAAYHIMNPSYPINGSQFTPPGHMHPGYPPLPPPNSQLNGASGPGIPGHPPQYAYSVHPPPYPHPPGYPPYPQYAQQMMMYAPPRPNPPQEPPQRPPSPPQPTSTGKRKRKSDVSRTKSGDKDSDDAGASGSDVNRSQSVQQSISQSQSQAQQQAAVDMKKRTKTQRACDSCRSRKIRCDILADSDPPTCQHCKQYGFDCTFFLPITETRFKKKKTEDDVADKEKSDPAGLAVSPLSESHPKGDVGVFGPTSATHLLHSQATISSRIYESYDLRYHHTWEVSKSGDGLIQVEKPPGGEQQLAMPKPIDLHIERDVIERLLNAYFTDVAPILPVITQAEFLAAPSPPPILLYSMCLVAAGRREVPQSVFDSIRYAVNSVIKAEDVLSTASIVNVQALLILCMMGDCHSQFVPNALSALWIRLGTAIRMAQDLGLHRAESVSLNIELRRRLWGACVISDRWTSLTYGHPHMIDVEDCDARLPSSGDPNDLYMDELVRLSVILGRVLKTIYSPSGLTFTTDAMLCELLNDLESWKNNLPEDLKFKGPDTHRNAGLLHLLYACVSMIFWRVFMRISYSCPAHLKFGLTIEQWSGLVELTGQSIDWLDAHERLYDVWLLVAYCATSCALVQYHTWARRKDSDAADKLRTLRDCVRRWEGAISPDHLSARRKTAEIIALLYEATQGPPLPIEAPALNPTGGVIGKGPVGGLSYKKDTSRPGGGVFIAHKDARAEDLKGVPSYLLESEEEKDANTSSDRTFILSPSAFAPPLPESEASSNMRRRMMESMARHESGGTPISAMSSDTSGGSGGGGGSNGGPAPRVNFTPLAGRGGTSFPNVNPAMDTASNLGAGNVQVMNVLDVPQASNTLEQFALADGFLEGIPGGMFDWGQWDTFFSRIGGGGGGSLPQRQQQQSPAEMSDHSRRGSQSYSFSQRSP